MLPVFLPNFATLNAIDLVAEADAGADVCAVLATAAAAAFAPLLLFSDVLPIAGGVLLFRDFTRMPFSGGLSGRWPGVVSACPTPTGPTCFLVESPVRLAYHLAHWYTSAQCVLVLHI